MAQFFNKIKFKLVALLAFTLYNVCALAQDCSGPPIPGDPDGGNPYDCEPVPLDNWVIVLFVAGLVFTTWYLHKKQKKEAIG